MLTKKTVVRLADYLFESPRTHKSLVARRRRGKWRPFGFHVADDPTLAYLKRNIRDGRRMLLEYAHRAAATDLHLARLIEKFDALSPGAQRAVSLTDLCRYADVTPARFIAAVTKAALGIGHAGVLLALSCMDSLPAEVAFELEKAKVCTFG